MDSIHPALRASTTIELIEERAVRLAKAKKRAVALNDAYRKLGHRYHLVPVALRAQKAHASCLLAFDAGQGCPKVAARLMAYTDAVSITKMELYNTDPQITLDKLAKQVVQGHLLENQMAHLDRWTRQLQDACHVRYPVLERPDLRDERRRQLAAWAVHTQDVRKGLELGSVEDDTQDILDFIDTDIDKDVDHEAEMFVIKDDRERDPEDDESEDESDNQSAFGDDAVPVEDQHAMDLWLGVAYVPAERSLEWE